MLLAEAEATREAEVEFMGMEEDGEGTEFMTGTLQLDGDGDRFGGLAHTRAVLGGVEFTQRPVSLQAVVYHCWQGSSVGVQSDAV